MGQTSRLDRKGFDSATFRPKKKPVSAKANGREPKTGLGRVFNFKSGCFDDEY